MPCPGRWGGFVPLSLGTHVEWKAGCQLGNSEFMSFLLNYAKGLSHLLQIQASPPHAVLSDQECPRPTCRGTSRTLWVDGGLEKAGGWSGFLSTEMGQGRKLRAQTLGPRSSWSQHWPAFPVLHPPFGHLDQTNMVSHFCGASSSSLDPPCRAVNKQLVHLCLFLAIPAACAAKEKMQKRKCGRV